ncbi:Glycosyl transferase group 1 [Burkholderia multivorans]
MTGIIRAGQSHSKLVALQIGMGWFPEQAGGLNRYFYDLIASGKNAGMDQAGLVCGAFECERGENWSVNAFAARDASISTRLWLARKAVAERVAEYKPDVVAAHFALYSAPALGAMRDRPLVAHFHGPWCDEGAAEGQGGIAQTGKFLLERTVYRRASRHIVLSEAFGTILHERFGIHRDRIRVIPGGVDASKFDVELSQAAALRQLGWPLDRPIVLVVRRLAWRMGHENLIRAIADVRKRVPEVLVHIVGKGPLASELQRRVDELDLSANVRLVGYVSDEELPVCYRAATLSVVPTVALEGFGLITLESLAAGTPVLVTPVGGLPEAVSGLSPNLVLGGSGHEFISDALVGALTGSLRLPDSGDCKEYVRRNFSWPEIALRIRKVYEEALQE